MNQSIEKSLAIYVRKQFSEIWRFLRICSRVMFFVFMGVIVQAYGGERSSGGAIIVPPLEPADALKTMQLADENLKIELFATEPLITDPVAMEIDEFGRIYVVEMPGYPLDTEGSGRVKLLQDTNGDGYPMTLIKQASGTTNHKIFISPGVFQNGGGYRQDVWIVEYPNCRGCSQ